jgi:hypothetical protein
MVDLPDPEGPISPIVDPASKVMLRFLRTFKSGLDG